MLLVDDGEAEVLEDDRALDDGVSADEDVDGAVGQSVEHLLALLTLDGSREHGHVDVHALEKVGDGLQVLFGENLGGRHDAGLEAVVDGDEHRHQRDERLTRPHVALQQTVHLTAGVHVVAYLVHHALLRIGQLKVEVVAVEGVELVANLREEIAAVFVALRSGVTQDVELHIEQFLKLQPLLRLLHFAQGLRVMDVAQRLFAWDEVEAAQLRWQQCL